MNYNLYCDTRSDGPMCRLFIQLNWTSGKKQNKKYIWTPYRIFREEWSKYRKVIEPHTPDGFLVRDQVQALVDHINNMPIGLRLLNQPETIDAIKAHIQSLLVKRGTFIDSVEQYIKEHTGKLAKNTIRNYQSLVANLKAFGYDCDFKAMSPDRQRIWFSDYLTFLISKYENSSIKQEFKLIRSVRTSLGGCGISVDLDQFTDNLKVGKIQGLHCTAEEVATMLRETKNYYIGPESVIPIVSCSTSLQVFAILALTGMRISELRGLTITSIVKGDNFDILTYTSAKTGTQNSVPVLHEFSLKILSAAHAELPPDSILNKNLHEGLRRIGGFDQIETRIRYKGSERIEEQIPRWKAITMHSARHTYSYLMTTGGMTLDETGALLNHGSGETTRKHYHHANQAKLHEKSMKILEKVLGSEPKSV